MDQAWNSAPGRQIPWPDLIVPMEQMAAGELSAEIAQRRRALVSEYSHGAHEDPELVEALARYSAGTMNLPRLREVFARAPQEAGTTGLLEALEDLERYATIWGEIGRRQRLARINRRRAERTDLIIARLSTIPDEDCHASGVERNESFGQAVSARVREVAESVPAFAGDPRGDRTATIRNNQGFDALELVWNVEESRREALWATILEWWVDAPVSAELGQTVIDALFPGWETRGDTVSACEVDMRSCMTLVSAPELVFPEWNSVPELRRLVSMLRAVRAEQFAAFSARGEYARRASALLESDIASIESYLAAAREADRAEAEEILRRRERREEIPQEAARIRREGQARVDALQQRKKAAENGRPRAFRQLSAFGPGRLSPELVKGASFETLFGWLDRNPLDELLKEHLEIVLARENADDSPPSAQSISGLLGSYRPEILAQAREAWSRGEMDYPAIADMLDQVIGILWTLCTDLDRHIRSGTNHWRTDAMNKQSGKYFSMEEMASGKMDVAVGSPDFFRIHPIFRFWMSMTDPLKPQKARPDRKYANLPRCYLYVNRPGEIFLQKVRWGIGPQMHDWLAFYNSLAQDFLSTIKEISMPYCIHAVALEIHESLPVFVIDGEIAQARANLKEQLAQCDEELRSLAEPNESATTEDSEHLRQEDTSPRYGKFIVPGSKGVERMVTAKVERGLPMTPSGVKTEKRGRNRRK